MEIKLFGGLGKGKYSLIDDSEFEKVKLLNWRLKNTGYVYQNSKNGIALHRFIMNAKKGEYIDHINHNPLDNRKCNLRICTNIENNWNKKYIGRIVGVSRTASGKKWRAYLTVNGKQKWLGAFVEKNDAIKTYNQAVEKYRDIYAFRNVLQ